MAPPDLSRLVYRLVKSRESALAYRDGELSLDTLCGFGELDDAERDALVSRDLPRLYGLGTHPMLLFHLSAIVFGRAHYIRNVVPAIQETPNPYYDYYADRSARDENEQADG